MTWTYISCLWEDFNRRPSLKMEWMKLETEIREVLKDYANGTIPAGEGMNMINELVAVRTGRGLEKSKSEVI